MKQLHPFKRMMLEMMLSPEGEEKATDMLASSMANEAIGLFSNAIEEKPQHNEKSIKALGRIFLALTDNIVIKPDMNAEQSKELMEKATLKQARVEAKAMMEHARAEYAKLKEKEASGNAPS